MSKKHDRQFTDLASMVVGGLIGIAVGIFALSSHIGARAETQRELTAEYRDEVRDRIAPFGKVAVAGQDNSALAIPATGAATAAPKPATVVLSGEEAYRTTCSTCHATGIGGAPKFGDRAAWQPRIAQGLAVLHAHALGGITGKAGVMPARGGRPDLADRSVVDAVDYIVKAAKYLRPAAAAAPTCAPRRRRPRLRRLFVTRLGGALPQRATSPHGRPTTANGGCPSAAPPMHYSSQQYDPPRDSLGSRTRPGLSGGCKRSRFPGRRPRRLPGAPASTQVSRLTWRSGRRNGAGGGW